VINVGKAALYLSAIISAVLLVAIPYVAKDRRRTDAVRACYWWLIGVFGALTAAILVLLGAFIAKDFSFQYVAGYSSADMAVQYRMAALWAGHEGSLLLWAWMLAGFAAAIAALKLKNPDQLDTYALAVINDVQLFLLAILVFAADPFVASAPGTTAGQGINPLLMHWAMVIHPPTLFLGYAGLTIPFAYAMATAWVRDPSSKWLDHSQRWSIFAWLLLSIGIFLGALWAYVVLGWGGFWGWDPVENASFLPWLTATAMLHSFTVYKRRDAFKLWSLSLATVSFLLVVMATFITRGGFIQSVHTFAPNNLMVWLFSGFIILVAILAGQLISSRYQLFQGREQLTSLLSKEFMYFFNNVVLLAGAIILLGATIAPVFGGPALKPASYNTIAIPIGLIYLIALGLCPVLAWRKTDAARMKQYLLWPGGVTILSAVPLFLYWQKLRDLVVSVDPTVETRPLEPLGYVGLLAAVFTFVAALELFYFGAKQKAKRSKRSWLAALGSLFVENRSQAGGYTTHLGVAVIVAGLVGSMIFTVDINDTIPNRKGAQLEIPGYSLRLVGVKTSDSPAETVETGQFDLVDAKTKKVIKRLEPSNVVHKTGPSAGQNSRNVDIEYQAFQDVFIIFGGTNPDKTITLEVKINPLIMFVWIGSGILVLGMVIAYWPRRKKKAAA